MNLNIGDLMLYLEKKTFPEDPFITFDNEWTLTDERDKPLYENQATQVYVAFNQRNIYFWIVRRENDGYFVVYKYEGWNKKAQFVAYSYEDVYDKILREIGSKHHTSQLTIWDAMYGQ